MHSDDTLKSVRHYYAKVLKTNKDLKTTACCCNAEPPREISDILGRIHPVILERFYGCGAPFPPGLDGRMVLDLGCGSGRDAYVLSALVGSKGHVIGVDMTPEQLQVARGHQKYHARQFGYKKSNVEFIQSYIEDLSDIASASVDLVISNCVINLSPEKQRVFSEISRVLKPGGELYFSDVFADRRISQKLQKDEVLLGECLSGAMYLEDFRRLMAQVGFADVRCMSRRKIGITDETISRKIGDVQFSSMCIRAFKLALEDRCEDYGQVACYKGNLTGHPHAFALDDCHTFRAHQPMLVCGNTADMLSLSHYGKYFRVEGNKKRHFGLFPCGPTVGGAGGGKNSCC